jgi:HK97 gp10 family phage protein
MSNVESTGFRFTSLTNKVKQGVKKGSMKTGLKMERTSKQIVNVDTGRLKGSISTKQDSDGDTVKTKVGTNVEYAKAQEFGNAKFPGKPYLGPAFYQHKDDAKKDIKNGIKGELR